MTEKIENFISKMIDGKESREDLIHYQNEFRKYVTLPKNTEIYKSSDVGWKQLLKPILKEGSDPHNLILIDSIITEEEFWKGVMDLTESKHASVVSENFLRILQDHHIPKQPLHHLREFREKADIILNARLKAPYLNDIKKWNDGELEKTKDLMKNEMKEILSIEFMHSLGGSELLGVVWNQFNPSKSLADASSMEIALFLQATMNQREQLIFVPPTKVNKVNVISKTPLSDLNIKVQHEKKEWKNNNENSKNKQSFKPQQHQQKQLSPKKKVEEKKGDGGCEICMKAGKAKAAATHLTSQHDNGYVNKKWGEKKQKVETKIKNQ
jgi:hypothetical protein